MPDRLSAPIYNILLALGTETRHGYGIMLHLAELTGGAEELLPGTLYATLARMLESGLIEEARPPRGEESAGPPRRHYRLTARGKALAEAETERMRRWVTVARRVWQPGLAR